MQGPGPLEFRRGSIWLVIMAAAVGIVAAGAFAVLKKPPARANVLIAVSAPSVIPGSTVSTNFALDPQRRVNTVAAQLQSGAFLKPILAGKSGAKVETEATPGTDLIAVRTSAATSADAQQIAQTIIDEYRLQVGQAQLDDAALRLRSVSRSINQLKDTPLSASPQFADLRVESTALQGLLARDARSVGQTESGVAVAGAVSAVAPPGPISRYGVVPLAGILAAIIAFAALLFEASVRSSRRSRP